MSLFDKNLKIVVRQLILFHEGLSIIEDEDIQHNLNSYITFELIHVDEKEFNNKAVDNTKKNKSVIYRIGIFFRKVFRFIAKRLDLFL